MRLIARAAPLVLISFLACRPATKPSERLELSAETLSLQFGEAQTVTAQAFVGTKAADLVGLTWASSDATVVSVTTGELGTVTVQGLSAGTATVTAALREATATVAVTVAPQVVVLERLEVTPAAPSVAKGLRTQLRADGVFNDGSTRDLTGSCAWASSDEGVATVSSTGLVTAVGLGTVEVRALKSGQVGRVMVTVTAATVVGVDVRPAQLSLALGTAQQLSATARLSDATSQDVTAMATWASSTATVATVDAAGLLQSLALGMTTVSASVGGVTGTAAVTVTDAVLRSLALTPPAATLPKGTSQALTLTGTFSDGTTQDVTTLATWRSGTPAVATVSSAGVVTAVGLGLSVVTASLQGISASGTITTTAPLLQGLALAPQGASLPKGLTRAFTATGVYTDGTSRDLTTSLTWDSQDAGVAQVSNAPGQVGLVRAVSEGTVTLSATDGTLTGTASLTVVPAVLQAVQVTPATATVPQGLSQQFTAQGTFSDGTQRDLTAQLSWTTGDAQVATASPLAGEEGLVTGRGQGATAVTAGDGTVSGSASLVVAAPVLQRLTVTGPAASLARGRTQQLTATGGYSDGSSQDLTAQVTWAPASGAVLGVSTAGLLSALAEGTAEVTASLGLVTGRADFTVTPAELDSIAVTPAQPLIPIGLTRALTATGTFSDGTTQVLSTGVTWSAGDGTVAQVSSAGLVSTVAQGQVDVVAAKGAVQGTTRVTVGPPSIVALTVTPAAPVLDKGATQAMDVTATYSDGATGSVLALVAWTSSLPGVVSVSSAGVVSGVTPGTATVKATVGAVEGSTVVTVRPPALVSLEVSPTTGSVTRGGTLALTATATYADSSTAAVSGSVTWSSSDLTLATVSAAGVVSGLAVGAVTVTASLQGLQATTNLTVTPPTLTSIAVTGPAVLATGTAARLVATGTYSDGSTADVSAAATWSSDAASVSVLTATGMEGVVQGVSPGAAGLVASVGAVASASFAVQVVDASAPAVGRCATGLVMSQVYGAGGNSGASWRNDFVELHNPTTKTIRLAGASLQYASTSGTTWSVVPLADAGVAPGGYFLVQLASSATIGTPFTADQSSTLIQMSATNGKVALVSGTTALTGGCPQPDAGVLDFVGFGTANCFEGDAGTPAPSATTWLVRRNGGCADDNQNGSDFQTSSTLLPRSSASAPVLCSCFVNGTVAAEQLTSCLLLAPATLVADAGTAVGPLAASVTQPGLTDGAGFDAALQVQVGVGPALASPTTSSGWTWWPAVGLTAGVASDDYAGVLLAPDAGTTSSFTARASRDGINWTACDLNGAGSGVGLSFDPGQLGVLTTLP